MAEAVANQNPDLAKMIARTGECMRRLVEAGVTYEDLQKPIDSPLFRKRLLRLWHSGKSKLPGASFEEASQLCDGNFVPPSVVRDRMGLQLAKSQLTNADSIPFNVEELKEKGKDHILVWDPGFSIFQMIRQMSQFFNERRIVFGPYIDVCEIACWRLIRRGAVPYTNNKVWHAQLDRLGEEERVPSARALIYAAVAHSMRYGDQSRLYYRYDLRTFTIGNHEAPIVLCGDFSQDPLTPKIALEAISEGSMFKTGLASETLPESVLFE